MEKIRTLVVDDEPNSLKMLCGYIQEYTQGLEVVGIAGSAQEAIEQIGKLEPKLVFLDISMPGEDGIQLIERYRKRMFELIFVTAHKEYAVNAFELGAIHYLLKPVDIIKLQEAVERSKVSIQSSYHRSKKQIRNNRLKIPNASGNVMLKLDDISFCKSDGSYTVVHLRNGKKHISSQNLKLYEDQFIDAPFFRIHRQYIINLNAVSSYTNGKGGYVLLECGSELPISYRKKTEFIDKLSELS